MEVKDYEYRKNSNKNRIAFTCEQQILQAQVNDEIEEIF